jgi:hypothetical protein
MLTGGYPSEAMISLAMETGQIHGLPWSFWFYLCLMLVTTIITIAIQLVHRQRNIDLYKYKEKFEVVRYLDFKTMRNRY